MMKKKMTKLKKIRHFIYSWTLQECPICEGSPDLINNPEHDSYCEKCKQTYNDEKFLDYISGVFCKFKAYKLYGEK